MSRLHKRFRFEMLESRDLLASVWQAAPNVYDVDTSGVVVPSDALLVINDLDDNGRRDLPVTLPNGFQGPLCDVNGDGRMSPVDALLIINILDQVPATPSLDVNLAAASDFNGDQVVLRPDVIYEVVASPNSMLKVEKLDGSNVLSSSEIQVGEAGRATLDLSLDQGANHLRFTVKNIRGFTISTERVTRLGDVITQWNSAMLEIIRESTNALSTGILVKPPPPVVAKHLAMVHGAMFDAVNAIQPNYDGYAYTAIANSQASVESAAAAAAYYVAQEFYSTDHDKVMLENTLNEVLATVAEGQEKSIGIAVGQQAAQSMIANRANDGSSATSNYQPVNMPGHWQPTAPSFLPPTLPHWPGVKPFALTSGNQFRPSPAPDLNSTEYAEAVDEVMQLGSVDSTLRTDDQTEIARFWADGGGTATPPGHWNIIAADVLSNSGLSLIEKARVFALLNYAMADAGIASWDAKYAFDLWRPIDAIRKASSDGNSTTTELANWSPLLATPSFPSYTSGHSTFSGAAAAVLTSVLGDDMEFTTWADPGSTGAWPPADDVTLLARRSFTSFTQAAAEAGQSRIYGGIHFNFDNTAGLSAGNGVGNWTVDHILKPKL
jgi:PAP2 superfamily/Dockerin type I domain